MRLVALLALLVGACGFPALPALDKPLDAHPGAVADAPPQFDAAPDIDAAPASDAPASDAPATDAPTDAVPIDGAPARLAITLDPPTLATELKTVNTFTATLTGSNGFAGPVGLAASVGDPATGNPITGWTADLDASSVDVPLNGTATVHVTLHIAALRTALAGKVKLAVTSGASGTPAATAQVTATDQLTWNVGTQGTPAQCVYPADAGTTTSPVRVSTSTKLRFLDTGSVDIVIHGSGVLPHQDPGAPTHPGNVYEQVVSGPGTVQWYCHAPGPDLGGANPTFTAQ